MSDKCSEVKSVMDWRLVQGVPCLRPLIAGIGSSAPRDPKQDKRFGWWMDGNSSHKALLYFSKLNEDCDIHPSIIRTAYPV